MKYNIIPVQTPKATDARLYTYILDNFEEIDSNRTRPLVLICPGGGYEHHSPREGEAVAVKLLSLGTVYCQRISCLRPALQRSSCRIPSVPLRTGMECGIFKRACKRIWH